MQQHCRRWRVSDRRPRIPRAAGPAPPIVERRRPVVLLMAVLATSAHGQDGSELPVGGAWKTGDWRPCEANGARFDPDGVPVPPGCGGGLQHRDVTCGSTALRCNAYPPPASRFCVIGDACGWVTSSWSVCHAGECGQLGVQTRTVSCVAPLHQWPGACPHLSADAAVTAKECVGSIGCDWWRSDWSSCSRSCGQGTQERIVQCTRFSGCSGSKPQSLRPCEGTACSWVTGEWGLCSGSCGSQGVQTREVHCELRAKCTTAAPPAQRVCPGMDGCARAAQGATPSPPMYGTGPAATPKPTAWPPDNGGGNDGETESDVDYYDSAEYFVGYWAQCDAECGVGLRTREVYCQKTCSVYRCQREMEAECQSLGLQKPIAEEACQGKAGPYAGTGSGGACLADTITEITGVVHLRVSEAGTFVSNVYAKQRCQKAIFDLAGGGENGIELSMVTVSLRVVADAGRRLIGNEDGSVAADYSIALSSGLPANIEDLVSSTLRGRSLPQVQEKLRTELASETSLQTYHIQVDGLTVEGYPTVTLQATLKPTAAPTPPPSAPPEYECVNAGGGACIQGASNLVGCFSSCTCCVQKNSGPVEQTPAPLAEQAPPLVTPDTVLPRSSGSSEDGADATDGDDSINFVAVLGLVGGGFVIGVFGALLSWYCFGQKVQDANGNPYPANTKASKIFPAEAFTAGDTVYDESHGQDRITCECGVSSSNPVSCDSCGRPRQGLGPTVGQTWSTGRHSQPQAEDEQSDGGLSSPSSCAAQSPTRGPKIDVSGSGTNGAAGSDHAGAHSSRKGGSSSPSRRSRKGSKRNKSEGTRGDGAEGEAHGKKDAWYEGMAKDYRDRKEAKAKSGSEKRETKRAATQEPRPREPGSKRSDPSTPSRKNSSPPRGTATPPRSTDGSADFHIPGTPSSPSNENTSSEAKGNEAEGDGASGDVVVGAEDFIAELEKELDQTMAKDLDWRRRNFKTLLLKWHPDKNRHQQSQAAEVFKYLMKRRAAYLET